jgi:hypothetical protein
MLALHNLYQRAFMLEEGRDPDDLRKVGKAVGDVGCCRIQPQRGRLWGFWAVAERAALPKPGKAQAPS